MESVSVMSSQLSFFPEEYPSARKKSSLFVAFVPDEPAIRRIVECRNRIADRYGPVGNLVRPELLHVTLVWMGDYEGELPPRIVRETSEACTAMAAGFGTFPIQLGQIGFYKTKPGSYPLIMKGGEGGNPQLMEFQEALKKQLALRGTPCKDSKKFDPHLTLSRGSLEVSEATDPVHWIAGEVVLLQSLLGESRYVTLGKWQLAGPPVN